MRRRMGLGLRRVLALQCTICGSNNGHTTDCPMGRLDVLHNERRLLPCPTCETDSVEVNKSDWFECRNCNTQFSRSIVVDTSNPEKTMLHAPDESFHVYVLKNKGTGDFLIDEQIQSLQEQIERRRQK